MRTLTREDAVAAIVSITPLSASDIEGFLACTDREREILIEAYRDSGVMPSKDVWDDVLTILKACAETAAMVIPITGAISGIFGVMKGP